MLKEILLCFKHHIQLFGQSLIVEHAQIGRRAKLHKELVVIQYSDRDVDVKLCY